MQDTEIETPLSLEELIQTLDKVVEGKPGIKPSEAWRYREEVRAKYGLPECGYLFEDPVRFMQTMEELLTKEGLKVRNKHEFSLFFRENPGAQAVNFGSNVFREATTVVRNASESDWYGLRDKAKQLAHESVHAMQEKRYPMMPAEVAEKEAFYYHMLTPQTLLRYKDDPDFIIHFINKTIAGNIKNSVSIDNKISPKV